MYFDHLMRFQADLCLLDVFISSEGLDTIMVTNGMRPEAVAILVMRVPW
jgi:response regulator of citrate/malate metabolism